MITRIGDQPLDSQGNVKVRDDLRLSFQYLVPKLVNDGRVKLPIVRDQKTQRSPGAGPPGRQFRHAVADGQVSALLHLRADGLDARQPGLCPAAGQRGRGVRMAMSKSPLLPRRLAHPAFEGEEIVTLGYGLLPHKTSKGYTPPAFAVVERINGTAVRNLVHPVELLRDAKGEFLTVELAGAAAPLVFRRGEMPTATEEILSDEGIRKQYSDDLESVWHRGK